jgi:chromosome segregation ATPase
MNEKDAEMLEEAMPLFNIGDSEMRKALADFESNEGIEVDKSRNTGMNGDDEREFSSHHQNSEGYRSKWSSSKIEGRTTYYDDDGDDCNGDENENEIDDHDIGSAASATDISVIDFDDLPDFADEECRELSREIKILERKRDDAAKNTKEHRDRVSLMKGHLNNVRQEIVHTNGLLAAKQKEIDTEKHLIALADREKAAVLAEIQDADEAIKDEKEKIRSLQIQIYVANEGLDKLKLSLNWNQVELEQWATAAAKKESDNLALEKFQRADEVKIKDLTLKLEHLTKLSAEKQAELENEKTETQSKQLEIDRVTKLFKANHEERRQLVEQWQKTVNAMKERDEEIDQVSVKYKDVTKILDVQLRDISVKRDEIFDMKVRKNKNA